MISYEYLGGIMIRLEHLTKTYAKSAIKAVDDLSLEIRDGEIFGFLGPNGAGKTTTLKMLTGVLKPDSGRVEIGGIDMASAPLDAKARFGFVGDDPELFNKLRAREYLNFVADIYRVPDGQRQERIASLARRFRIADVLSASIGSFSRGMKQKLCVIASLLHDPEAWVLDEPMVGLDPQAAFDLKELMRERTKAGGLVLFSTHVMEVAEKVCDRIAIIDKGKLRFVGRLDELRAREGGHTGNGGGSLESLFLELVDEEAQAEPEAIS
jgi:ABC-2 type transport system ATP-binding protein